MNAPHSPSLLSQVPMAPGDPILGITEQYVADQNPKKVNLGVGVYYDDAGKVPLLECIRRAESERSKSGAPWGYLPIDGLAAYDRAVQQLVFGEQKKNIVTVQALGGTGGLNFSGMRKALSDAPAGTIVVLHACCHNPTGVDLSADHWKEILALVQRRGLVPFLDLAYQGFGDGLDSDAYAARLFAAAMSPVFLSSSFSKSFSLYGERVGAFSIVAANAEEAARVLSQVKRIVRTNYSNPPSHGGQLVAAVLSSPELRKLWEEELAAMRDRIKRTRLDLASKIKQRVPSADFSHILNQRGMFSYSGLTKDQVLRLRKEYSIYAIESGRICVAALNSKNVDYVAEAIAAVIR